MKLSALVSVLALFLLSPLITQANTCRLFPNDPFEPSGKMPEGPFKGRCIETEERRSYILLKNKQEEKVITEEKKLRYLDPKVKYQFIANVNHEKKFWTAAIPVENPIERVVFQVEHFPPEWIAAHTQLRFDFKDGAKPILFSQTDASREPVSLKSLVLSIEAVPMRGGPTYDLIKGIHEYFALGVRLVSLEDKVDHIVFDVVDTTDQFVIQFQDMKKLIANSVLKPVEGIDSNQILYQKLWAFALKNRADPKMIQMYDTIKKSCTNSLFEMFDDFMKHHRNLLDRAATALPIIAKQALEYRGLIGDNSKLLSLNQEFHGPTQKPKADCKEELNIKKID